MAKTQVTILNSMAGQDFEQSLNQHQAWGIGVLDLKDAIFGKRVSELTTEEAFRVSKYASERNLSVYCISTGLFFDLVEKGEAEFATRHLNPINHLIEISKILEPALVRLLAARTERRTEITNSIAYLQTDHPWVIPLYAEAIDRLYDAGFQVTIENEVNYCIFSTPQEILAFFNQLDRPEKVCLTWDVQNLWQMGTYPTINVYEQLKHLIGYFHLKGGIADPDTKQLRWRSSLEDATWPVIEITQQVVADGISPVICLNPSHGDVKPNYNYQDIVKRDVDFIRQAVPEIQ